MNENNCCVNCFSESEIINFITGNNKNGDCDYCKSINVNICNVKEVGDFVWTGLQRYYEDAAESVGYCSSEGGYLLPTNSIDELLINDLIIFGDDLDDPRKLIEDLVTNDGTPYVRKSPYGPPSGQPDEIDHWNNFCELVKSEQRFTALVKISENEKTFEKHPFDFLDEFVGYNCDLLIGYLYPGQKIFRARIYNEDMALNHGSLTSLPPNKTRNNRMSPAGISFFYGGMDSDVCIGEVRPSVGDDVVVAEFEVLKQISVLDLSIDIKESISIFSEDYSFEYEEFIKPFLRHFSKNISRPIRSNDSDIEYVPTQIFTEFLKIRTFNPFPFFDTLEDPQETDQDKIKFKGMKFKSSLHEGGVNIVLFQGPSISTEDPDDEKATLLYKGYKKYCITSLKTFFEEKD